MPPEVIYAMYEDYPPGVDWYLPLGAISMDAIEPRLSILEGWTNNGVLLRTFDGRYYFNGGAAPQAVGYVRWIQEAELDAYRVQGYSQGEKVGGQGLERWGEDYLAGDRGGILYIVECKKEKPFPNWHGKKPPHQQRSTRPLKKNSSWKSKKRSMVITEQ